MAPIRVAGFGYTEHAMSSWVDKLPKLNFDFRLKFDREKVFLLLS